MAAHDSKTLLAVRLSSLGDIVLTQPVLAQANREGWRVDLLGKPAYHGLGEIMPGVDRVVSDPAELRDRYDVILDLHATLKVRNLLREIPATRLVHYRKRSLARRLLVRPGGTHMFWNAWAGLRLHAPQNVTAWYSEAGEAAGLQPATGRPEVRILESADLEARAALDEAGAPVGTRYCLLAPGAKWATKRWPLEFFAQTAIVLREKQGLFPVFVGGPEDQDLCSRAAGMAGGPAVSLAGKTGLPALAALFRQAAVGITNDSGPLHLGLAAGCPVVALFGPTVAGFGFAPLRHPKAVVLSVMLPCKPCSLHGSDECPQEHHNCLRMIPPDAAVQAAVKLISLPRGMDHA